MIQKPHLRVLIQREQNHYLEKILKSIFNAVLFIIAKQPKCPSMNE